MSKLKKLIMNPQIRLMTRTIIKILIFILQNNYNNNNF